MVTSLLCNRESSGYDAIVCLFLQKRLLRDHNIRYKVMEPLEINKGQMESLDTSDINLRLLNTNISKNKMHISSPCYKSGCVLLNFLL